MAALRLGEPELNTLAAELFEAERRGDYHPRVEWADLPPQTVAAYLQAVRIVVGGLQTLGAPLEVA